MSEFFRRLNESKTTEVAYDKDGDFVYRDSRLGEVTFHTDDKGGSTDYDDKLVWYATEIGKRIDDGNLKIERWSREVLVSSKEGLSTDIKLVAPKGMEAVLTIYYDKDGLTFDMDQFGQNPMSRYADLEGFTQDKKQNFDAAIKDAITALQGDLEDINNFRVLWPRFGHAPYYGK